MSFQNIFKTRSKDIKMCAAANSLESNSAVLDSLHLETNRLRLGQQREARASSDTDLTRIQEFSSLSVDKNEYILGHRDFLTITWNIHESVSHKDWIGLFPQGKICKNDRILLAKR